MTDSTTETTESDPTPEPSGGRGIAILQLMRLPTVFTSMADVIAGYLLTTAWNPKAGLSQLTANPDKLTIGIVLVFASSCLYLAGMVFNDIFDRKVDAEERPGRPIPSGSVPLKMAIGLGLALLVIGNGAAWFAGRNSGIIAAILTVTILAYDGLLKKTPIGPLAMGACRFLNVIIGASHLTNWASIWTRPQLVVALGMGVYVIGLTWFARTEAKQSKRWHLIGSMVFVTLGVGLLSSLAVTWSLAVSPRTIMYGLIVIVTFINYRLLAAVRDPQPFRVQAGVKTLILSIVTLDAAMVYFKTGSVQLAIAILALLIPAMVLKRWIPMT